mmetsp:Transcript_5721/g.11558  ORF Transcript_5721/g.11558 Transcript_5721/m.11558 type:complete len:102 (-) Transcript_5721:103-408(-)
MAFLMRSLAKWHQNYVAHELQKFGLKFDDILNEADPDVDLAVQRLTPEELSNRNKRLMRAMDISAKHCELTPEAQLAVKPMEGYLQIDRARQERLEKLMYK